MLQQFNTLGSDLIDKLCSNNAIRCLRRKFIFLLDMTSDTISYSSLLHRGTLYELLYVCYSFILCVLTDLCKFALTWYLQLCVFVIMLFVFL